MKSVLAVLAKRRNSCLHNAETTFRYSLFGIDRF